MSGEPWAMPLKPQGNVTTVWPSNTVEASVDHSTAVVPGTDVATTRPVPTDNTSTLTPSLELTTTEMKRPSGDHWGRAYEATANSVGAGADSGSDAEPRTTVPWSSGIEKSQTAVGDTATKRSPRGEIAGSQRFSALRASSSTSRLSSQIRVRRGDLLSRGAAPGDVQ